MSVDLRRSHERYKIETPVVLCHWIANQEDPNYYSAKILDVSDGGLSCSLPTPQAIPTGDRIMVHFNAASDSLRIVEGVVRSCQVQSQSSRVGIMLKQQKESILENLKSNGQVFERRKSQRRSKLDSETQRREFDRRGVWPGLLAKRDFSHHAWDLKNHGVYFFMKPLQSAVGNHVNFGGREMIMMASNNYLGLNTHPKVKEAAIEAIKKYGTGSSGSNLVGGTYDVHIELEEALAKFLKTESACICISGYVANTTTLTTVLNKDDAVFNDSLNHASLIDGSLRNGAYFRVYRHNDIADLDRKLGNCKRTHKLVVADAVFSMDGDIARLPELIRVCKKHNAGIMLDQAHATGVFGESGRGVLEHFGLDGKADILVGTMSKSLGAIGGYIAGSKELINILKHTAREIFFSTNVAPSACASILAALEVIKKEPERRLALWRNAEQLRSGLKGMGFDTGASESPIIPVIFPTEDETNAMVKKLLEHDIYATPIIYPAVKRHQTRIRLSVIATHTPEDIEKTLMAFEWAQETLKK